MKLAPVAAAVIALGLWAGVASANGRFPFANQLVVDPSDGKHIVLRTTYGVLQTFDAGANWNWLCETSVGYGGKFDPAIGVTKTGRILVGLFDGMASSTDRGCNFTKVGESIFTKQYMIDLVVEQKDPARVVAITSTGLGDAGFHVALGESLDGGQTWKQAGADLPKDFNSETVEVAPSRSERIYASGIVGTPRTGVIQKSDDRGATWERLPIELGKDGLAPYLAAVDPNNPDVVWARIDGDAALMAPDRLMVSRDGAKTWTEVGRTTADMLGFALSPDGSKVAFGGPLDGVWIASTTDPKPTRVSSIGARCLTWTPAGLYVCATEYPDGFTVGLSTDEGKSFTPMYKLANLSPLECAATTTTGSLCAKEWPAVQATIGAVPIEETGPQPVDSGAKKPTTPPNDTSCGCSLPGRTSGSFAALALALAAFLRVARRRC